jgi:alkanesulfonate monooxygenase SsuD/methylene tetrahydromethanopterin reductase-like flavin-dependent oxidoreductase (luciferase family)
VGGGYLSYVVTPEMYSSALRVISEAAEQAGRGSPPFGTGHLLFVRLDRTYEAALDRATETTVRVLRRLIAFVSQARRLTCLDRCVLDGISSPFNRAMKMLAASIM